MHDWPHYIQNDGYKTHLWCLLKEMQKMGKSYFRQTGRKQGINITSNNTMFKQMSLIKVTPHHINANKEGDFVKNPTPILLLLFDFICPFIVRIVCFHHSIWCFQPLIFIYIYNDFIKSSPKYCTVNCK